MNTYIKIKKTLNPTCGLHRSINHLHRSINQKTNIGEFNWADTKGSLKVLYRLLAGFFQLIINIKLEVVHLQGV